MSNVIRQFPDTDILHVSARSPESWWMRHPGGPRTPSMSVALIKAERTLRTLFTRSRRIPRLSFASRKRFNPRWRTLRTYISGVYGKTVLASSDRNTNCLRTDIRLRLLVGKSTLERSTSDMFNLRLSFQEFLLEWQQVLRPIFYFKIRNSIFFSH